jgi:hypothetical protein
MSAPHSRSCDCDDCRSRPGARTAVRFDLSLRVGLLLLALILAIVAAMPRLLRSGW